MHKCHKCHHKTQQHPTTYHPPPTSASLLSCTVGTRTVPMHTVTNKQTQIPLSHHSHEVICEPRFKPRKEETRNRRFRLLAFEPMMPSETKRMVALQW